MPGIWTSLATIHPSIFWPIDGVFRIDFVISGRPEITALLTTFPRATMLILIMGVAHTKALVLDLTPSAASKRNERRIATYPLLTTGGFHQRCLGIATEPAMLAGNRRGFHTVVSHRMAFFGGVGGFVMPRARLRAASRRQSFYPRGSSSPNPWTTPLPQAMWVDESVGHESTLQSHMQSQSVETQSHAAR